jgi:hypothetical protein
MESIPMSNDSEAIARRIDEYLNFLRSNKPTDDEYKQKYYFRFMRSLCRARDHGRLTYEQKHILKGILRNYSRMVIRAQRMGRHVPHVVLGAIEDAKRLKKHGPPRSASPVHWQRTPEESEDQDSSDGSFPI